jgi:PAS domain S-box-containing protein
MSEYKKRESSSSQQTPQLWQRAEEFLQATRWEIQTMPVEDVQRLVHKLQAHQEEKMLEMANQTQTVTHRSLMKDMEFSEQEIAQRKAFLDFDDEDVRRLEALHDLAKSYVDGVIEDFYRHLLAVEESRRFFTDPAVLARVKAAQKHYFLRLTQGNYDSAYVEDRLRIGVAHERINLPFKLYLGAYNFYLRAVLQRLVDAYTNNPQQATTTFMSPLKLVFLDTGLAIETYLSRREEALSYLAAITESSDDAIISKTLDGMIVSWNAGAERLYGYTADEVKGQPITLLVPPDRPNELPDIFTRLKRGERIEHYEVQRVRKDGCRIDVSLAISAIKDSAGRLIGASTIARDITARRQAERRAAVQYATTRVLAEAATLPEASLKILQVICESLGWDLGELWEVDRRAKVLQCVALWHAPSVAVSEFERLTRQTVFAAGVGVPGTVWTSGTPTWITDVIHDATFVRTPVAATAGLRSAVASPIRLGDQTLGVMVFLSRNIRQPDHDLLQMFAMIEGQIGQFIERKRAEEALHHTYDELERRGEERTAELVATNAALQVEIAARKQTEEALRQSEARYRELVQERERQLIAADRLVSFGELAASLAHEFNNPLGIVLGFAQDLLSETDPSERHYKRLRIIEVETQRCAQLMKNLLNLAHPPQTHLIPTDLASVIRRTLELIAGRLRQSKVTTVTEFAPALPQVQADPQQLEQVLLNLFFHPIQIAKPILFLTLRLLRSSLPGG